MVIDEYGNRRFFGLYRGVVIDNRDPLGQGRLRIKVPQVLADQVTDWAWANYTPGVQNEPPAPGAGIFVMFEGGDPSFPIWTAEFTSAGSVDYLQLEPTYTGGSTAVGMLTWDPEAQTPQVKVGNGEVTLQIGQEFHIIVANNTATTIPNGSVVYFNGGLGAGGHPTVLPYLADGTKRSFLVAGITTQDILPNNEGLVTSKGVIHDLNTSSYGVGDVLFASPLFPGKVTNTQPTPPDEVVVVAVVTKSAATTGQIYVTIVPVIQQLTTTINLYQTTVASDISGYFKMVNSQLDPAFSTTAISVPITASTLSGPVGTQVLLSSYAASANLFTGDPGASISVTTAGNIMKMSGNVNTQTLFYFTVWKRTAAGVETLVGTSSEVGPSSTIPLNTWQQFSASALVSFGSFTNTDRIIVKFHAHIVQASGAQSYAFQFGDSQPVYTRIPVPVSVVSTAPASGVSTNTTNFNHNLSTADDTVQKALDTLDNLLVLKTTDVGTVTTTILADGSVTYPKIQNVSATNTFLGRKTAGAGVVEELSANNAITALNTATTALAVGSGGTGATTLTGYVKGAGTSALTASTTIPIADLSDFSVTTPSTAQVLTYNGTKWANATAAGRATVSATAPASPVDGDAWYNTNNGFMFFWVQGAWVQDVSIANDSTYAAQIAALQTLTNLLPVSNGGTGATSLTSGGYLKGNGTGAVTSQTGIPGSDITAYMSPNYLINGAFDVWQRGTSFAISSPAYTADRWLAASSGATWSQDSTNVVPGTSYSMKCTMSSASQPLLYQCVETLNAVALAGQTITLSAYLASSVSVAGLVRVEYSTTVDNSSTGTWTQLTGTVTANLTTTLTRYSSTVALPSTAKSIRVLCAPNVSLASGNTFTVGAVQLEAGSVATAFRRNAPSVQGELAACQRYYQYHDWIYGTSDGYWKIGTNPLGQVLRTTPSSFIAASVGNPNTGATLGTNVSMMLNGKGGFYTSVGSAGAGAWISFINVTVSAEL